MSDVFDSYEVATVVDPAEKHPVSRLLDRIKQHERTVIAIAIIVQLLILVAMIALHSIPLLFGQRILLRVLPVDPRNLFRGDYVVLSYELSRPPADGIEGLEWNEHTDSMRTPKVPLSDRPVYVTLDLDTDGIHHKPVAWSIHKPKSGLFIRGRFTSEYVTNMEFGIESFFVQEGAGRVLEQSRNANNLSAEIAVTSSGQARVVALK